MNATNRVTNRVLLFLTGVILLLVGAASLASGLFSAGDPPAWFREPVAAASDAWVTAAGWSVDLGAIGAVPVLLLIAAAVVIVLTVLLLVFVCTRGRGRTKSVLWIDAEDGRTTVDTSVADAVLTAPLLDRPDVLSARASAYRVKKTRAIELAVIVRPGASLANVVSAAEAAISDWDALLGSRVPVMLHLSDRRWRDAFQSRARVQ